MQYCASCLLSVAQCLYHALVPVLRHEIQMFLINLDCFRRPCPILLPLCMKRCQKSGLLLRDLISLVINSPRRHQ